jgi:hypothetical protein
VKTEAGEPLSNADIKRLWMLYKAKGYHAVKGFREHKRETDETNRKVAENLRKQFRNSIRHTIHKMIESRRMKAHHQRLSHVLKYMEEHKGLDETELRAIQDAWEEYKRPWYDWMGEAVFKWISNHSYVVAPALVVLFALIVGFAAYKLLYTLYTYKEPDDVAKFWCERTSFRVSKIEDKGDRWEAINIEGYKIYVPKNLCVVEFFKE